MNITQQIKERARKSFVQGKSELIHANREVITELKTTNKQLDTLIETTITELIEHIEGEIGERKIMVSPYEREQLSEGIWDMLVHKRDGYNTCHFKVISLLSDIKKGV